uniref:Uncharacterized protein n=1 Tax=Ixodes ricinus TaxID=34613 RepID=A0A6B0UMT9_IXORI
MRVSALEKRCGAHPTVSLVVLIPAPVTSTEVRGRVRVAGVSAQFVVAPALALVVLALDKQHLAVFLSLLLDAGQGGDVFGQLADLHHHILGVRAAEQLHVSEGLSQAQQSVLVVLAGMSE